MANIKQQKYEAKLYERQAGVMGEVNTQTNGIATTCIRRAADLVGGDRDKQHGSIDENFTNIARLWSAYLNRVIDPADVALMMGLLKIGRTQSGEYNLDDYVDAVGYLGIAAELGG